MTHKCTPEALKQARKLRTSFPWAVANNEQIVVAVFNYRDEAKGFAKRDPKNLVAYDASGVIFAPYQSQ